MTTPATTGTDEDDSTVTHARAAWPITVQVDKTNDANGDGTFTDTETAARPVRRCRSVR